MSKLQLGVMQSRLSTKPKHAYQGFNELWWDTEFLIAKRLGFDYIEWICDNNPGNLAHDERNWDKVVRVCNDSQVKVKAVCADYFVKNMLNADNKYLLLGIINFAAYIEADKVVLPFVDESSLKKQIFYLASLKDFLKDPLKTCWRKRINLCLELDLPPKTVADFLKHVDHQNLKICYDTGNSAAEGYNPNDEFDAYGQYINHVHIKDRVLHGESVKLGTGAVNFKTIFNRLKDLNYAGTMTYQGVRAEENINQLSSVEDQMLILKSNLERYYN